MSEEDKELETAEKTPEAAADAAEEKNNAAAEPEQKAVKDDEAGEKKQADSQKTEKREDHAAQAEIAKLKQALAESDDKYRRMIAEYDNYRKRTAKEREGIYADAYADALKELLPVKDALELAVKYSESDKVVEGVQKTLSKFSDTFQKLGVEEFGKANELFDPNIHNAVVHVEDEAFGENVIAEVLMKGYRKGDRILRHAMVKVAN